MKKVELVNLKQPAGGLSKWLDVKVVLKWSRDLPQNSSAEQPPDSAPTDTLSRTSIFAASRLGILCRPSCWETLDESILTASKHGYPKMELVWRHAHWYALDRAAASSHLAPMLMSRLAEHCSGYHLDTGA